MTNYLPAVKKITSTIVGIGAGKIITTIIANNVTPQTTTDKVAVTAGSFALGMMVGDVSSQYTDAKIDEIANAVKKFAKK